MTGEGGDATPEFTLRPATRTDVSEVLRLIRGLADYERLANEVTATETDLHEALFGPLPRIHAILAEVDGKPVGLALYYYTFNTFKLRRNIFLEDLFVEPAHRAAGIGFALMRRLAQQAVEEECGRIEWRVLNWNQPAIDFYERLGAGPIKQWHPRQLRGDALVSLAKGIPHG